MIGDDNARRFEALLEQIGENRKRQRRLIFRLTAAFILSVAVLTAARAMADDADCAPRGELTIRGEI